MNTLPQSSLHPLRPILCIEDNPEQRQMVISALREYDVVGAGTKAEGLEHLRKEQFSLVIIDYLLPDGTGEELYLNMRVFDNKTPVLFITGWDNFTEVRARAMGAQGTLKKGRVTFVGELRDRVREIFCRQTHDLRDRRLLIVLFEQAPFAKAVLFSLFRADAVRR